MLRIIVGVQFAKDSRQLPASVQERLSKQIEMVSANPFDTRLHTKPLSGPLQGLFSFRVGRDYRALFRFINTTTIFLVRIADRKDIYR